MLVWALFLVLICALLALDLGVFHREARAIPTREALLWTAGWIALSLVFNGLVYLMYEHHWLGIGVDVGTPLSGDRAALQFFTAYLVEKSLSLDNLFVIALVFAHFNIPAKHQHRVLFWGILGALVLRGAMIFAGIAAIQRFSWIIYVFGGLLIATALRMLIKRGDHEVDFERKWSVRLLRRLFPITSRREGSRFFVVEAGKRMATPMFVALVIVEASDVMFAVDSIPAAFGVSLDPFIVFTSNVFAILGLRSLYFALAAVLDKFRYLEQSLVFVLAFVGVKMIASHHVEISAPISLGVIAAALGVGVIASIVAGRRSSVEPE